MTDDRLNRFKANVSEKILSRTSRVLVFLFLLLLAQFLLQVLGQSPRQSAWAAIATDRNDPWSRAKEEISRNYGGAKIQWIGPIRWANGTIPAHPQFAQYLGDDGHGNAHLLVKKMKATEYAEGWVHFSALLPARVAIRRVHLGEPLTEDAFISKMTDVSSGPAFEIRGVLLSSDVPLSHFEATQTILEGQLVTKFSIRQIPDVQRGDSVEVQVNANGVNLTIPGIAQEPGYLNKQVRVLAGKQKRELRGTLLTSGVVGVNL